ncbi:hypothetical protein NDU88_008228 [Pleurodeles waltl]|uniref:Uncharacterized protein n=1 Tax=Pleurodeles waltl TaxID=8319 RepID=A0AAV7VWK5_PLEWA|nr:hypothetical protein NDU88_008228 [Pleurodeles waltl]
MVNMFLAGSSATTRISTLYTDESLPSPHGDPPSVLLPLIKQDSTATGGVMEAEWHCKLLVRPVAQILGLKGLDVGEALMGCHEGLCLPCLPVAVAQGTLGDSGLLGFGNGRHLDALVRPKVYGSDPVCLIQDHASVTKLVLVSKPHS